MGNSFIELAEHQPIEKISVSDIVAASGKNRKTFYYHFESKEHLIRWVFRRDLADVLKANVADDDLLFEPEGDDSFPSLPYYVHKKVGVRSLDGSVFFDMLAECFQYRRSYYAKTLRMSGPDSLQAYLYRLYVPAWRRISASSCRTAICRRETSDSCRNSIRGPILSYLQHKVCDPTCADITADVKPFQNIVHSSLESEIKKATAATRAVIGALLDRSQEARSGLSMHGRLHMRCIP